MTEYSKMLTLEKGSFTTIANNLEKKGLIKRTRIDGDKRKNALFLTDEGKEITSELNYSFKKRTAEKLSSLSTGDLIELENALETITKVFDKMKKEEQIKCQN